MPQVGRLQGKTTHSICVRIVQFDRDHTLNVMAFDLSLAKICGKSRERLKDRGELKDMASWEII